MIGHERIHVPECESTQVLLGPDASEGTIATTDHQTAGRGRLGRRWVEPPGSSLLLSVLLRPPAASRPQELSLVAAVATAQAVEAAAAQPAQIKWPNDVLLAGAKVAGILAELRAGAVVLGIGVNVNQTEAQLPLDTGSRTGLYAALVARGLVLDHEHVRVEVGLDLLAGLGERQVAEGVLNVWMHALPVEPRVVGAEVAGVLVPELLGRSRLRELEVESGDLLQVPGVAELADEVRGPHEAGVARGVGVVLGGGNRETGGLDATLDELHVDELVAGEALLHEQLSAIDVVRGEGGVGGARRQLDHRGAGAGGVLALLVLAADPLHVADVVAEQGQAEVEPVLRRHPALADVLAAQDLLPHQRHQDGVVDVVVEGIAVGDVLEGHAPRPADDLRVVGLVPAVGAAVALLQVLHEGLDLKLGDIEHCSLSATPGFSRQQSPGPALSVRQAPVKMSYGSRNPARRVPRRRSAISP